MKNGNSKSQLRSLNRAAHRVFGDLFSIGEPLPINSISGDELSNCDPTDGLAKFVQNFQMVICPVLRHEHLMCTFTMLKEGSSWGLHSFTYGTSTESQVLFSQVAECKKTIGHTDFRLIDFNSLNRQCLSYNTPAGLRLYCLRYWPNDPDLIRRSRDPIVLLNFFKEEWARKKKMIDENTSSDLVGGSS
ncbi:MAG: hypothetical protein P4L53_09240 [Candidatus Obscuribacterales bacterium]|nr:hypothetical protein [Candidatus Obscuribacterales bacterium]